MNRRALALTFTAAAVLGLTACSGATAVDESADTSSDSTSSSESAASGDRSITEACADVQKAITEASGEFTSLDVDAAMADPQGTVQKFQGVADRIGDAVANAGNDEVKAAGEAVHAGYVTLADVLQKVLVDQDLSAIENLTTLQTDLVEDATAFAELCQAG